MKQQIAIVALGSNLGDSKKIVLDAISRLQSLSDKLLLKSSLWQTSPVNCPPDSPKFINAVVAFAPKKSETPESLLKQLQEIEKEFGRTPKKLLNEPRPLDLDLIAFGQETRRSGDLILPHPRALLRKFVLEPLNEIAPDLVLPGQGRTVSEVLEDVASDETV
jgi:2-amino-4-hydroxy-6-hydroxymethyldihydropteridine diphosphokinase